ncbi:2-succinylbenzoate--CoA ligase, chloroplastic/peroxisomal-like protein [Drosera capensis]
MPNRYSNPHISQCLSRILTLLTVSGDRVRTGEEFVDGVLGLANGLVQLGLRPGDVVAVSVYNGWDAISVGYRVIGLLLFRRTDSYLEWLLAVAHVGGILAPLNYRWD